MVFIIHIRDLFFDIIYIYIYMRTLIIYTTTTTTTKGKYLNLPTLNYTEEMKYIIN